MTPLVLGDTMSIKKRFTLKDHLENVAFQAK